MLGLDGAVHYLAFILRPDSDLHSVDCLRSVHDWAQRRNGAEGPSLDDDRRFSVEDGPQGRQEQTFPGADCMQGTPLSSSRLPQSASVCVCVEQARLARVAWSGSSGSAGSAGFVWVASLGLLSDVARFLKSHGSALNAGTRTPPGPRPTKPPPVFCWLARKCHSTAVADHSSRLLSLSRASFAWTGSSGLLDGGWWVSQGLDQLHSKLRESQHNKQFGCGF